MATETPDHESDTSDITLPSLALVHKAAEAIWDKKGFDVVALRVREIAQYTDYLVIASATSDRHAMAIADHVEAVLHKECGSKSIGSEGRQQGRWVLIDFGDIVVHVFHRPVRDYYELERLYADAPRVELTEPAWLAEISPDTLIEQSVQYGDELWQDVQAPVAWETDPWATTGLEAYHDAADHVDTTDHVDAADHADEADDAADADHDQ